MTKPSVLLELGNNDKPRIMTPGHITNYTPKQIYEVAKAIVIRHSIEINNYHKLHEKFNSDEIKKACPDLYLKKKSD